MSQYNPSTMLVSELEDEGENSFLLHVMEEHDSVTIINEELMEIKDEGGEKEKMTNSLEALDNKDEEKQAQERGEKEKLESCVDGLHDKVEDQQIENETRVYEDHTPSHQWDSYSQESINLLDDAHFQLYPIEEEAEYDSDYDSGMDENEDDGFKTHTFDETSDNDEWICIQCGISMPQNQLCNA